MRPSLLSAVALTIVALYALPAAAQILDDASVEFEDQTMDGDMVVVASVTLPEGGFVVIHDDTLNDGDATGSVVGVSEYLEAGTHTDVNITVQIMTNGGNDTGDTGNNTGNEITLIAMPHQDTNNNQEYDFEDSNGQDDGPYTETVGGGAVTDEAMVTMEEDDGFGDGGDGLDDPGDDVGADDDGDDGVDDDEDTPGFGAVALLALLGAVAVLRRR